MPLPIDAEVARNPYVRATAGLVLLTLVLILGWLLWRPTHEVQLASYLPLHTFLETCSIIVCVLVFVVSRASPGVQRCRNLVILGTSFLGVAQLDFLHAQSYLGMPALVTPSSPEKAINFWLAARLLAACALLTVAYLNWEDTVSSREADHWLLGMLAGVALVTWVFLYRPQWMPRTFIPGYGLTTFKILAEFLIVGLSAAAAVGLYRVTTKFPRCDPHACEGRSRRTTGRVRGHGYISSGCPITSCRVPHRRCHRRCGTGTPFA